MFGTFLSLLTWIFSCGLGFLALLEEDKTARLVLLIVSGLLGSFSAYRYVKGVFPIWLRLSSPPLHLPFYPILGSGVLMAGVLLTWQALTLRDPGEDWPVLRFWCAGAAAGAYLAAAYPFWVFSYTRTKEKREIAKRTTGSLTDASQLKRQDFFKTGALFLGVKNNRAVFLPQFNASMITYGGTGSGKTTTAVVPNLLHWPGSIFCIDPTGELSSQTAAYRRSLGQEVVILNPTGVLNLPNTSYNPLSPLIEAHETTKDPKSPHSARFKLVDKCQAFCMVLLPEPNASDGDKNKQFRDEARTLILLGLLQLVVNDPKYCNLVKLRELVADENKINRVLSIAFDPRCKSILNGVFFSTALAVSRLLLQSERYFYTLADEALKVYHAYGHLGRSLSEESSLRMASLIQKPTTIYLIFPPTPSEVEAYRPWIQLIIGNALDVMPLYGSNEPGKQTLFLLEEFGNIGKVPGIDAALQQYRKFGFRAWLILQNRHQLTINYGQTTAKSMLSACATVQVLTVDVEHAEELSKEIGKEGFTGNGTSGGGGSGLNTGSNSVQERPVLEANQILELNGKNKSLLIARDTLTPSVITILDKCPYWRVDKWADKVAPNPLERRTPPAVPASQRIRIT